MYFADNMCTNSDSIYLGKIINTKIQQNSKILWSPVEMFVWISLDDKNVLIRQTVGVVAGPCLAACPKADFIVCTIWHILVLTMEFQWSPHNVAFD